jgi:hypothetical protein
VVHQGDVESLEFVDINGAAHPTEIKGLDKAFTFKRGQVVKVEFTADKPGVYPVICSAHHARRDRDPAESALGSTEAAASPIRGRDGSTSSAPRAL